jgi:hypothetical protein
MSKTATFKFEMAEEVKDQITGFVGFVVTRVEHITGCNTYWVQRKHKPTEEVKTSEVFDEVRLASTGKAITLRLVQIFHRAPLAIVYYDGFWWHVVWVGNCGGTRFNKGG